MSDVDVHADRQQVSVVAQRVEQIRCSGAKVDDHEPFASIWRHAPQQAPVDSGAAEVAVESAKIAKRSLHVRARSVVLVE